MSQNERNQMPHSQQSHKRGIDWDEIHARLQAAQSALEQRLAPGQRQKQDILRTRAQQLMRPSVNGKVNGQSLAILEFLLASEHYGIGLDYIREVYPLTEFTPLPCTPSFVLGLANVRGQILSIIDIKKFFDLPEKGLTELNKVIVVQTGQMELGILADAVLGVRSIALHELQSSLPTLTGVRAEYLRGVTNGLVVLDAGKILSDSKIVVNENSNGTA